jgi:GNAT superfamily N-acetyltransferase
MSTSQLSIRLAHTTDSAVIAEYNLALAWETESKRLDPETVAAGVAGLLAHDHRGRYFVACDGDRIVGQLMHTREWSDWRNGDIWWLQSVYVHPDYRGRGVFRSLLDHVCRLALETPQVVGLRLYMETHNETARKAYLKAGFQPGGYEVFERWNLGGAPPA